MKKLIAGAVFMLLGRFITIRFNTSGGVTYEWMINKFWANSIGNGDFWYDIVALIGYILLVIGLFLFIWSLYDSRSTVPR